MGMGMGMGKAASTALLYSTNHYAIGPREAFNLNLAAIQPLYTPVINHPVPKLALLNILILLPVIEIGPRIWSQ
jgi:hypothetical protein